MVKFLKNTLAAAAFFLPLENTLRAETGPLGFGEPELKREFETDRPDFTEGTQSIEPGHLQLESGYTYLHDGSDVNAHVIPEILLRVGMFDDYEFRLGWPGYVSLEDGDDTEEGVADLSFGIKQRLLSEGSDPFFLSVIYEMSAPSGSEGISADEIEAGAKILWAFDTELAGIAGNLNFFSREGEFERYAEGAASITAGFDLTEELGHYIEFISIVPLENTAEDPEHYFNGGFTYMLFENTQLDWRAGVGINHSAADFFTGAGLSVRM